MAPCGRIAMLALLGLACVFAALLPGAGLVACFDADDHFAVGFGASSGCPHEHDTPYLPDAPACVAHPHCTDVVIRPAPQDGPAGELRTADESSPSPVDHPEPALAPRADTAADREPRGPPGPIRSLRHWRERRSVVLLV